MVNIGHILKMECIILKQGRSIAYHGGEMKINGYLVEYDNENQVCIIPKSLIPFEDFIELMKMYSNLGYKNWIVADERRGYILSKI